MRRHYVTLSIAALLLLASPLGSRASAQTLTHSLSAPEVVARTFSLLNAGMKSGDFSALATVYAPDATLTRSTPKGTTAVYHGLAAIMTFYKTLPTIAKGYQWATDTLRTLTPDTVLAYESAGTPSMAKASRCFHVVRVQNGVIQSYDWVVFFPGKK